MKRTIMIAASLMVFSLLLAASGCDKEKIVESTEYVHDIEYVELPADTVYLVDTVFSNETVDVHTTDTVTVTDTVVQVDYAYDTTLIYDTTLVYDTVEIVEDHYDTTAIIDTVITLQCNPNEHFAINAMQLYTNPLVIEFIYQEFGYDDGWIFYLGTYQLDIQQPSSGVYDLYGFIDYWTPDWSGFYALEFYWRVTYTGGDPADPANWNMSEPPAVSASHTPGIKLAPDAQQKPSLR